MNLHSGRMWRAAVPAALLCAAAGMALAESPKLTTAAAAGAALIAALVVAPTYFLPAILLAGTAAVPIALSVSSLGDHGLLVGQASWIALVAGACLVSSVRGEPYLRLPTTVTVAYGLVAVAIALELVVGSLSGELYPGFSTDAARELVYPLAAIVGVAAVAGAPRRFDVLQAIDRLIRPVSLVAIGYGVASSLYWLNVTGRLAVPLLSHIFGAVHEESAYQTRSVFPLTLDSPNTSGTILVMLGALCAPVLFTSPLRRDRRLGVLLCAGLLAGVLVSQSRTALLAAGVAPWPCVALGPRRVRQRTLIALAVLSLFAYAGYKHFPVTRHFSTTSGTFVARQDIWSQALHSFGQRPVLGHGFEYSEEANFVEPASIGGAPQTHLQSVQSEYLGHAVDGGLVGLVLFGSLLVTLIAPVRSLLRNGNAVPFALGYAGLLLALGVSMAGTTMLESAAAETVLWLTFGVATGLSTRGGR